jgi:hypothetical protein
VISGVAGLEFKLATAIYLRNSICYIFSVSGARQASGAAMIDGDEGREWVQETDAFTIEGVGGGT